MGRDRGIEVFGNENKNENGSMFEAQKKNENERRGDQV